MLGKRVGLGLAARGDVRDTVDYALRAERAGLEAVWLHDSYFERDAVTYLAAIATEAREIRVGAGALNPYTRHPVALAMTASALDDLAPGRFALALGSGLPLRLAQMAIPYDDTVEQVSACIDTLRALWRGDRVPLNPAVPPVQPMFPPPHRVPIFIAGYQRRFVELCGQKADGYLARPAESVPALRSIRRRAEAAAVAAGRDPAAIEFAGYVLCLVEESRRAALNRAKREPFVIYMMSILSDVSLKRAGFPRELRDEIAAAWRAEDYHRAGGLIPDELLDAFLACGTAEDVAARAADYHDAGLDVPLLQPVLQEEEQVDAVIAASVLYATAGRRAAQPARRPEPVAAGIAATSTAPATSPAPALLDERPGLGWRARRRASAWYEILRPFSFTATLIPIAAGGALALQAGQFSLALFLVALLAGLGLHAGTNIINEIYDVRLGIDSITSPRASRAILKGLVGEREAFGLAFAAFALATLLGAGLVALRGWPLLALGLAGLAGGYFYTAPPFQYKYRALGLPLVFLLMGPLMVAGSYYAITGRFTWTAVVASVPVGLLVAAILHGNEWRDIGEDARYGFRTLSSLVGWRRAHVVYVALVVGAYISVALAAMAGALPVYTLLAVLSLPLFVVVLRSVELGATGQVRAIAMLDLWTARLHLLFGALLVAGLALAALR